MDEDAFAPDWRDGVIPEPGYYRMRNRAGPGFLPAEITAPPPVDPLTGEILDRGDNYEFWEAAIDGAPAGVADVYWFGTRITRGEYEWLTALSAIRN